MTTFQASGVSFSLEDDSLIVSGDRKLAKKSRNKVCGIPVGQPRSELTIPYYNVLWAELSSGSLVIDYAHASEKHNRLQPRRLSYVLDNNADSTSSVNGWIEALLSRAYRRSAQQQRRRRALVLVNPHAGPGGAARIWEEEVRPLFEAARLHVDATYTKKSGEAAAICERLDLDKYDMVVPCSGDGLAHEVFNGLGRRRNARTALRKIAVAHIPCGSGNAMSCNLNGSHRPSEAALAVVKGVKTPLDLMSVTQGGNGGGGSGGAGSSSSGGSGSSSSNTVVAKEGQGDDEELVRKALKEQPVRRTLSFLSQSVGIIAESDLGTEHMRWMGAMRFNVGIAQRIFSKKVYPCDIAVKVEIADKDGVRARYRQEVAEADFNTRKTGSDEAKISSEDFVFDAGEALPPLRYGSINDEIPDDWQKLECDKMGNFYCGKMPYMAPKANFFPASSPNDGLMDLVINDGNIPPSKYLELMTAVEKERFFDNPLISYQKVVAYRIMPRDQKDGFISIDGERIPFEPFQVEVHQGLATVISKHGRYEANGPTGWDKIEVNENGAAA